ncbi:MAG: hypothetical protein ACTS6J_16940 [Burkholderiales bacterium]
MFVWTFDGVVGAFMLGLAGLLFGAMAVLLLVGKVQDWWKYRKRK